MHTISCFDFERNDPIWHFTSNLNKNKKFYLKNPSHDVNSERHAWTPYDIDHSCLVRAFNVEWI